MHEDRLLCLPDQPGRRLFDRLLMPPDEIRRHIGLNRVQSHHVARGIVQGERDEIYLHHSGKTLGEIPKEFMEVAMRGDRLRNLQESLVPLRQSFTGR
jgi:hypothetical protein